MRKILTSFLILTLLAGISYADTLKVGMLSKLNMSEEEYSEFIAAGRRARAWNFFTSKAKAPEKIEFHFFDTLLAMQLALNAGEIEEMALPEAVANYIVNATGNYEVTSIVRTLPAYLAFGFKKGANPELLNQFNDAILQMKEDGTLAVLHAKYIYDAGIGDPEAISFRNFPNVDKTITVAVTGDLPPIDYVDAEGFAAGFNTAVISEIGKKLKVNINLVNIDAGARAATLASGRADAVFWIQGHRDVKRHSDIPEGIELSMPYYEWDEFFYIAPVKR
ncbi:MAG: transporter substrate-binding domain-containing protein [Synergistaceae bacterium]|nr:transporter substrate-binding domain-containing protein [Synergistaceae bacterium]